MADETQAITIRLPKDLYEQLRLAAFEDRTTQNAIITDALAERLARRSLRGKTVHRIDGDPRNNDPSNLEIRES